MVLSTLTLIFPDRTHYFYLIGMASAYLLGPKMSICQIVLILTYTSLNSENSIQKDSHRGQDLARHAGYEMSYFFEMDHWNIEH